MKTLKLISLIFGIFCISSAYSFTTLNLPGDIVKGNLVDKLFVYGEPALLMDLEDLEGKENTTSKEEDTIVIDLEEVVITDGLPAESVHSIQQQVKYPYFAMKQKLEGIVAVCMVFNSNGNIEIKESCSNHPELENYVINKLLNLQLSNCVVQMGKEYYVRFTFRLL